MIELLNQHSFFKEKQFFLLSLLLVSALFLFQHAHIYDFLSDDTLITLRFSQNLIEGHGLVYNVGGEKVAGYTSIGWVLLTALGGKFGLDLVGFSRVLGLFFGLATLCVSTLILWKSNKSFGALSVVPAFVIAGDGAFACWANSGLYTPAYAFFIVLSIFFIVHAKTSIAYQLFTSFSLVCLALIRPDGMFVGVLMIGLYYIFGDKSHRLKGSVCIFVPFVVIVVSHLIWSKVYFGDWLPNTYYTKVGHSFAQIENGINYVVSYIRDLKGVALWFLVFIPALWRRDKMWWVIAIVLLALTAEVIYVGGDGLPMYRFMAHGVALWAILITLFINDILCFAKQHLNIQPWKAITCVLFLSFLVTVVGLFPNKQSWQYQLYSYQKNYEIPTWTLVGLWLAENAEAGESFASVPIGAISFYNKVWCWDILGKTDRTIAHTEMPNIGKGWTGHEKHNAKYILSNKPTFLFLNNIHVREIPLPLNHPNFAKSANPAILARESDFFTPELYLEYKPELAQLRDGRWLHYLVRKDRKKS